ncbi:YeeE/YedE family protein [Chondromyces apiculatus]|uniref:Putative transmembrane protein n=1 Tax=Chondromyces apiculatus DSM 436 TaxID=1192034 RepID=A0A017TH19_9BACT|nr:YeeE/YedE family protein [Chondromyces apiculatus]EYF08110.1 putative transmembrane protein [Chondromyces apiculatus DSM 436]
MRQYLPSLLGGMLIGLSAALMLLLNGRIAGISGIVGGLLRRGDGKHLASAAFIVGLLAGPLLFTLASGARPLVRVDASLATIAVAGLLVGFGTRLGSGCTSGHGVAGLARLSPRSIVAVLTFISAAMITVFIARKVGT